MPFVTLMTDFGLHDGYSGLLKGVIWQILPEAQIADITHTIHPQNVFEAALTLERSAFFFPEGTVHVCVVDPGVGTQRRPIALRLGPYFFVGPDNGLFTRVMDDAKQRNWPVEVVHLDKPKYWLPEVSNVFHGRDIFSPIGAYLAKGVPLHELGTPIDNPVRLDFPLPESIDGGWRAQVWYVDVFGNLGTNIHQDLVSEMPGVRIKIAGQEIDGLVKTFGERPSGSLVALIDSDHYMGISVVNGSAAQQLKVGAGEKFEVMTK